ncbi:hypothetical protein TELCIR_19899 [Teladorsagia circumcincta]|uniref:PARP-type domain-containing protein n=1 Tax=Teladorsagia circumcincta TaxID=45464 RepID=A0A2G9TL18_TELCI|nr:hypothetical protein TELCIR_19899 [Teladorsagia circumcincta]
MVLNKLMKLNYHHAPDQNIWFRHCAWVLEVRLAKITPNPFVQREEGPPPDMKLYYHPHCLFEMFFKARANTKVIEGVEDIEGWDDVKDEDKEPILKFIDELNELRANKESGGGAKRTPKKKADDTAAPEKAPSSSKQTTGKDSKDTEKTPKKSKDKDNSAGHKKGKKSDSNGAAKSSGEPNEESKYNSFNKVHQQQITDVFNHNLH